MPADVDDYSKAIENVRHELKKWEWQFKQANGRKPGRDDVKNDATISAKYEEYDRLSGRGVRPRVSGKSGHDKDGRRVLEERSANLVSATPKKTSKNKTLDAPVEQEEQPTPACVRFALGPTPQKDGAILGLFDMLPSASPSKAGSLLPEQVDSVVNATPTKSARFQSIEGSESKTPQSSTKRYYLNAFGGTPLKRKREDDTSTPSTTKRQFATPAFLRRNHILPPIGEDGEETAPIAAPPFRKRGLVRSLSAIIHGLRKQEEERMDDEWDVLNEIEAEERGETVPRSAPKVLVEDSQAVEMPLGPDQGPQSDEDADANVDGNAIEGGGKPRKAWKKKGLKRQTRRVIMRPVLHKPKKVVDNANSGDEEDSQSERDDDRAARHGQKYQPDEALDDDKYDLHNDPDELEESSGPRKAKSKRKSTKRTNDEGQGEEKRKITRGNALAHTNFRKLKIKNKNSKANGRGRKFGRR